MVEKSTARLWLYERMR